MRNWELSAVGLIAAVVLVAVAFVVGPQHAAWTPTIVAGIVLLVIFTHDRAPQRSFAQSLAYAAACGFLLLAFAIYPIYQLVAGAGSPPVDALIAKPWLPAIWLAGSVIFLGIDRFRLGSKPVVLEMRVPQIGTPGAATPVVESAPAFATPQPAPNSPSVAMPEPAAAPPPRPVDAKPIQVPTKGTPATIYLNLVGTGIACLRSVKAEHLGRDFYRITEEIPQGEAWEFQTGQIVRCRKKMLSSGKAMVAYQEAPRAG
jgi:hypothetical protein